MHAKRIFFAPVMLLAGMTCAPGQPVISGVTLTGQPQTANDTFHFYARFSASPGADVTLTATASDTAPLHYRWQFAHTDLPDQTNAALHLGSLQLTNAGDYTVIVTDNTGTSSNTVSLDVDAMFTKVTTGPLVTDPTPCFGGTFGDFDNDGSPDFFLVMGDFGSGYPKLYHNDGDQTFTEMLGAAPSSLSVNCTSPCFGDYDNDGNLDLVLPTRSGNLLFRNNGDSTFARILTGSVVQNFTVNRAGASWADYDNDGFLDLFVVIHDGTASSPGLLYHNAGDGTFTSVTDSILVTDLGTGLGCAWADYDNDGWPDVFIGGGRGPNAPPAPNRLYHNNRDGTFANITSGSIVTDLGYCGVAAWADFANRGLFDLFVVNSFGQANLLYRNNGDGTFTRITNDVVATDVAPRGQNSGGSFGCAVGDYDNDGFLDLFVANRADPTISPTAVNFMYHNNGDGTFTKVLSGSPANEYSDSLNCAFEDYDNDGFLDLFVSREGGQGNYLYHNNGNSNNWLIVKPVGTASNRSAIGAKVRVKAFYRGASRWQLRQITGGNGYSGPNQLRAHFGLGDATNVDTVRIEWPSGTVQEFHNVAPRQILTCIEPPRLLASATNGVPQFSIKGGRLMQYDIQTSTNLTTWSPIGTLTITNLSGTAQIVDPNAPASARRFYRAMSH